MVLLWQSTQNTLLSFSVKMFIALKFSVWNELLFWHVYKLKFKAFFLRKTILQQTKEYKNKLIAEATIKVKFGFISSSSSQVYGAKHTVYYYSLVNFKRLQIKTILLSKLLLAGGTVWQLSRFFEEGNKLFCVVLHI